jgi:hypothetical protein
VVVSSRGDAGADLLSSVTNGSATRGCGRRGGDGLAFRLGEVGDVTLVGDFILDAAAGDIFGDDALAVGPRDGDSSGDVRPRGAV